MLSLLLENIFKNIFINEFDKTIYSFSPTVKAPVNFIKQSKDTPIIIEESQRYIYATGTSYSLDLAFTTLFLNRTNRSGIVIAGQIGGYSQFKYRKTSVQLNKNVLVLRFSAIANCRQNITIHNDFILQ